MADARGRLADDAFIRDLRRALLNAYDPAELTKSPLVDLFSLRQDPDPPRALRGIFGEAIAALKPDDATPPEAEAWRVYHILQYRYIELIPQRDLARSMALSVRQFRRHEASALRALANHLWTRYGLQFRTSPPGQQPATAAVSEATVGAPEGEMQWLRATFASEAVDIGGVVRAALKTVAPLLETAHITVACEFPEVLPQLAVQTISLRQAVVNVFSTATSCVPGGRMEVVAEAKRSPISIRVKPLSCDGIAAQPSADDRESLDVARQLVALSGGTLQLAPGDAPEVPFVATFFLPRVEQLGVLVIDDNADTQHLYQRYLEGTGYSYIGTSTPEDALALAAELQPKIIILDVMLPGMDGWEVLGRLREHPATHMTPIIVCTILPQERLARTLGAAAFLRKPVTRIALLAALDEQTRAPQKADR